MNTVPVKALHLRTDDDHHAVAIGTIRVLVCERAGEWFAQGVEIDYAASGTSLEDVQGRFERGLAATVHQHLKQFEAIDRLMKYAPRSAWQKLSPKEEYNFAMLTVHHLADLDERLLALPFTRIAYLQEAAAAA